MFICSYLLGLLANEGYLIISVPYNVTFDHSKAATEVYDKFHLCLDSILTSGLPNDDVSSAQLVDLPLYSVGHRCVYLFYSTTFLLFYFGQKKIIFIFLWLLIYYMIIWSNVALLQVLSGSYFSERIPKVGFNFHAFSVPHKWSNLKWPLCPLFKKLICFPFSFQRLMP